MKYIVNTIYLVDKPISENDSFTEYLNKDDKAYFLINNLSKKSVLREMVKKPIYKNRIFVTNFSSNLRDTIDFKIVPFLTELCFNYKNSNIVLISKNPKLCCLKGYFEEYLGYNIEIVPSIKFYVISNYIGKLLNCKNFESSSSIIYNLIRFKQLNLDLLDTRLKIKLSKNSDLLNKINSLYSEFVDIEPIISIPNKPASYFYDRLLEIDDNLEAPTLKRISHFLKKSESLYDFKEKMNSSNNLNITDEEKEVIIKGIVNLLLNS